MEKFLTWLVIIGATIGAQQTGLLGWIYRAIIWFVNWVQLWWGRW